jgi:predicted helicase
LVDESEFRKKIEVIPGPSGEKEDDASLLEDLPELPIEDLREAVYAAVPSKLGDRAYWSDWAKNVGEIAQKLIARIKDLIKEDEPRKAFDDFMKGLRDNIHPAITEEEAINMLAQHEITRPIFEVLFPDKAFVESNPVSRSMDGMMRSMKDHGLETETEDLRPLYNQIQERASYAKSDKTRQELINNLYDSFFQKAFKSTAERLGIVYTPVEVVDFINRSVDVALRDHFGTRITDEEVQVLDPFTGTGTFIKRLIDTGLIEEKDLPRKFDHELWANEIVLLAYYIAAINIEAAYHEKVGGDYKGFNGMVLTDTFEEAEKQTVIDEFFPKNSERMKKENEQDIRVIVSNPPYSARQSDDNEANPNQTYAELDRRIKETYADNTDVQNKNTIYDSYIRGIRWASDRIGNNGIIGFITNASFLEQNVAEGVRRCLYDEFSTIYTLHLRGNALTSGEIRKKEGGGVFGHGSKSPVAVTLLIKDPTHEGPCNIHYHDIGDYLRREEKLKRLQDYESIRGLSWEKIVPDEFGDWINQRDPNFDAFLPLGDRDNGEKKVFTIHSLGINTNRDVWTYNFSKDRLSRNMKNMIEVYNDHVDKFHKQSNKNVKAFVDNDPKKISWADGLKQHLKRGDKREFNQGFIRESMYRPFCKEKLYFDSFFIERTYQVAGKKSQLFPTSEHENRVISITGLGTEKPFSPLILNTIPNLNLMAGGSQTFPLYWYQPSSGTELEFGEEPDEYGYIKQDGISDWGLNTFQKYYNDYSITKENIFFYVYGVLHSPEYRERFQNNLTKELARAPLSKKFWDFEKAGEQLAELHLNYEEVEPYPLEEHWSNDAPKDQEKACRVEKMKFKGKKGNEDFSTIVYNEYLSLSCIPEEAFDYQVNGRSAIAWILDRYQVSRDKKSGIVNDPNEYSEDPRYIIDLLKRIVTVSVESRKIIENLPALEEAQEVPVSS